MIEIKLIIPLGTQIVSRIEDDTAQSESLCLIGTSAKRMAALFRIYEMRKWGEC